METLNSMQAAWCLTPGNRTDELTTWEELYEAANPRPSGTFDVTAKASQ